MPLPLSYRATIELPGGGPSADNVANALSRLEAALDAVSAKRVRRQGDALVWRGTWRVSNMHLLAAISRGRVTLEPTATGLRVAYELHFRGLLIASIAAAAVLTLGIRPLGMPLAITIMTVVLASSALFCGQVAITVARFSAFLRQAMAAAPR
ncbi:MAG TPA: hypothetical protein VGQ83_37085 [Polyangia bacterium]